MGIVPFHFIKLVILLTAINCSLNIFFGNADLARMLAVVSCFSFLVICCSSRTLPIILSRAFIAEISATTSPTSLSSSRVCAKCGSRRSGALSCCARGGAWFKKCGDAGDEQFDHTWAEGVQACKSSSTIFKSPLEVMIRPVDTMVYPQNIAAPLSVARQQTNVDRPDSVFSAGTTEWKGRVGLAKVVVHICVLFFSLLP